MIAQFALIALVLIILDSFRINIVAVYLQRRISLWYVVLHAVVYWVSLSYTLLNHGIQPLLVVVIGIAISWLINFISGVIATITRSYSNAASR